MSGNRNRVTEVRRTSAFWETLGDIRNSGSYASVRAKINEMVRYRMNTGEPHPREVPFSHDELKGFWHMHVRASPLAVLFYSFEGSALVLHRLGNHRDYAWSGKGMRQDAKTAARIRRSCADDVPSPFWSTSPRWEKPEELAMHPDLPELAPEVLDALLHELDQEAMSGYRFFVRHGYALEAATEEIADAHLDAVMHAVNVISDIRTKAYGAHYDTRTGWNRTKPG